MNRPLLPSLLLACAALAALAAGPTSAAPLRITVNGPDAQPLADAVVAIYVSGTPAVAPAGTAAELGQRGKRFDPPLLAVQTGTAVSFPNHDTVRHHVYSFSPIKVFEIKLYVGTPATPVVFDKPGVAVLGCNIHDAMSAFVRVVDTPYFARTDARGQAEIELPAGSHRVQIWHPTLPLDSELPLRPLTMGSAPTAAVLQLAAP